MDFQKMFYRKWIYLIIFIGMICWEHPALIGQTYPMTAQRFNDGEKDTIYTNTPPPGEGYFLSYSRGKLHYRRQLELPMPPHDSIVYPKKITAYELTAFFYFFRGLGIVVSSVISSVEKGASIHHAVPNLGIIYKDTGSYRLSILSLGGILKYEVSRFVIEPRYMFSFSAESVFDGLVFRRDAETNFVTSTVRENKRKIDNKMTQTFGCHVRYEIVEGFGVIGIFDFFSFRSRLTYKTTLRDSFQNEEVINNDRRQKRSGFSIKFGLYLFMTDNEKK